MTLPMKAIEIDMAVELRCALAIHAHSPFSCFEGLLEQG